MELARQRVRLRKLLDVPVTVTTVLDRVRANKYQTVAVTDESGTDVLAVMVHPQLLNFLTLTYDQLCKVQELPEWGRLRQECQRLRRISAGLMREVRRLGGAEQIDPDLWKVIQDSIFEAIEGGQALWTEERDPIRVLTVPADADTPVPADSG